MNIDERVIPGVSSVGNLQKHLARYNLILNEARGKEVLDLACGTGYGSFLMSMVANHVRGVDISSEAIEFAQNNYTKDNLFFQQGDVLEFGRDQEPVDLIVSFETVEHIKNLSGLENKFSTLLKTGGKLIYSVPLYENYDNPYHVHKFDVNTALSLFSTFSTKHYVIQSGINFTLTDNKQPFTYLIVAKVR